MAEGDGPHPARARRTCPGESPSSNEPCSDQKNSSPCAAVHPSAVLATREKVAGRLAHANAWSPTRMLLSVLAKNISKILSSSQSRENKVQD
jgi:hypothetical protein